MGRLKKLDKLEAGYGYRTSSVEEHSVIAAALLELKLDDPRVCVERLDSCMNSRRKTQPLGWPSAGSVFKNPLSHCAESAGALIERVGLKGYRRAGLFFSEMHANWILRDSPSARASDLLSLLDRARELVYESCLVELETELVFL